ncbi:hypothetical protein FMM68_03920 [Lachnospiraceae bacterium MD329]|nr:hypothetical protein [Lachnospiraceae bacterium MD329]
MQAEEQNRLFSKQEVSEIVKIAAIEGANAAIKHLKTEQAKEKQKRKDRRLYNTKLLIKHYRSFKEYVNNAVFDEEESPEDAMYAIEELMWEPKVTSDMIIDSIKRSMTRTKIIIEHIDKMIEAYGSICEKSDSEVKKRRYEVLYKLYISNIIHTVDEMTEMYFIDKRTVYKDIDAACKELSVFFFGIDGIGE